VITNISLQELEIPFSGGCDDAFIQALPRFLSDASSLVSLSFTVVTGVASHGWNSGTKEETFFSSLFEAVAQSSLRTFLFFTHDSDYGPTVAKYLAPAIADSALEQVGMNPALQLALSRTLPIGNLDFVLSQVGCQMFKINRRWKPLLSQNVPLGLWPLILEKAHNSIHGPEGIIFYLLRAKPELIPSSSAGLAQNYQSCHVGMGLLSLD
jgi:hypothetical protein